MTQLTPNLSLVLYDSVADAGAFFLAFRDAIDGTSVGSNFYLIDTAWGVLDTRLDALEAKSIVIPVSGIYSSGSLYTATGVSGISGSYVDKTIIALQLDLVNPGTTTLNINSLGVRTLVKTNAIGTSINLSAGDLSPNKITLFMYDLGSTTWKLIGSTADTLNIVGTAGNLVSVNTDNTLLGTLTQSLMLSQTTHAATGKSVPADADSLPLVDTAASNVLKKITWAQIKTNITTALGALIAAATSKSVPIGADLLGIADTADSNATKKVTITELFNQFGLLSHAWTAKTSIVGADEAPIMDSAASFANKRVTWTNAFASFGVLMTALTGKTTPVGADEFMITDSAASFANKKLTLTNLVAALKTLIATDTLAAPTDITTNNATTSAHGLLKKLPGGTADTFRGDGTYGGIYAPEGFLQNGLISVSVASNNITVAIKGMNGSDPSATNPVYCRINGVIRSITSALSVTKNAGTNWFNSGAAETATLGVDYFVYLGYNSGTSAVVIGFSRISHGRRYDSFSATTTAQTYCAISDITTIAAGDYFDVIGRFSATLSATASFNWSVPTFTAANLIQYPIYMTDWLTWTPTQSRSGGNYTNNPTVTTSRYRVEPNKFIWEIVYQQNATPGSSGNQRYTLPMTVSNLSLSSGYNASAQTLDFVQLASNTAIANIFRYDANAECTASHFYVSGGYGSIA